MRVGINQHCGKRELSFVKNEKFFWRKLTEKKN